ncbi:MAG: hypothetical protein AVDCRST_MAG87-2574, partial [uncultured Thermomicrobiales bacterium]
WIRSTNGMRTSGSAPSTSMPLTFETPSSFSTEGRFSRGQALARTALHHNRY